MNYPTPWVLGRWDGQTYQRMARFRLFQHAQNQQRTYENAMHRRGRDVRMSVWYEVPSVKWLQQELETLGNEYAHVTGDRRQEIRTEISKRLDDVYWLATAYRIPLESIDVPLGADLADVA